MIDKTKNWNLEDFEIFKNLKKKELHFLEGITFTREYKKNQVIYSSNEPSKSIFFCKSGRIKFIKLSKYGDDIIIGLINPGEIFGESSIFMDEKNLESAVVMDDCSVNVIKSTDIKSFLTKHPLVYEGISFILNKKVKNYSKMIDDLIFKDSSQRIASFILKFAEDYGIKLGSSIYIRPFFKQQEIADLAACSRQTVNALMKELRKQKVIEYDRRKLVLHKEETLKKIIN